MIRNLQGHAVTSEYLEVSVIALNLQLTWIPVELSQDKDCLEQKYHLRKIKLFPQTIRTFLEPPCKTKMEKMSHQFLPHPGNSLKVFPFLLLMGQSDLLHQSCGSFRSSSSSPFLILSYISTLPKNFTYASQWCILKSFPWWHINNLPRPCWVMLLLCRGTALNLYVNIVSVPESSLVGLPNVHKLNIFICVELLPIGKMLKVEGFQ